MCGPGRSRSPHEGIALAAALLPLAGGGGGGGRHRCTTPDLRAALGQQPRTGLRRPTYDVDVSRTGRYVVFTSGDEPVGKDARGDEGSGRLPPRPPGARRGSVSLATNGRAATAASASISPNGRFVAFCS